MKKNMLTYIIIGFVLIIGILISCNTKPNNEITEQKTEKSSEQNPYDNMRNMAFSIKSEQLDLNEFDKNDVYGIISEMDINGATATVVTFITGDTSLYLSTGGGFIGAGQHESVREIVKKYVKNGQKYLGKGMFIEKSNLPSKGMTKFNFLTNTGIYCIEKKTSELESGKSEFSNLFMEMNEIITQIRLKSEK